MRQEGEYVDWYCSGMWTPGNASLQFISEGTVTEEISQDLLKLGWVVMNNFDKYDYQNYSGD